VFGTYLGVRIDHPAGCPEVDPVLCAEQDIPDHEHHQGIDWVRADSTMNVGLGRSWQASLGLPFDLRLLTVDYTTPDGDPYDPPYGDNHHRDEVLWGLTDGRAMLWRYGTPTDGLVLGVGAGSTIPLGKTEENPFALAARGLEHEHFQLGSGTFDPVVAGIAMMTGRRWGGWASVDARLPVYANGQGYRAPRSVSASVGPSFRVVPELALLGTVDVLHETSESWDGTPYGGRQVLTGSLTALYTVSSSVVLQASGRATAWQRSLGEDEDEPLRQALVLTAGVSVTPRRREER